jgi:uncharacterized membrane protein YedE/YeeE
MRALLAYLRRDLWSPYVAGGMLGLVAVFSLWTADRMPGASGSFQNIAAYAGQEITSTEKVITPNSPAITVPREGLEEQFVYFAYTMPKGITWQVWLVIGIFLGSLASSLLSRGFKVTTMPHSEQWVSIFGPQRWKRWLLVFIGSIILQVAAGIAGGCTSGLAISGGVQLAPAAFLFIPAMFISGTLTALLVYRRRF